MPALLKKTKKEQSGFTLIELLVSISIMAVLLSIFVVNFKGLSGNRNLTITVNNFVSDIYRMQSYSLSSRNITATTTASSYGAVLSTTSGSYQLIGYDNTLPTPNMTTVSTSTYPQGIALSSILITRSNGNQVSVPGVTVKFILPYGRVTATYTGATDEANDIIRMKFQTTDNANCQYVNINGITGNIATQSCP